MNLVINRDKEYDDNKNMSSSIHHYGLNQETLGILAICFYIHIKCPRTCDKSSPGCIRHVLFRVARKLIYTIFILSSNAFRSFSNSVFLGDSKMEKLNDI